MAEETVVTSIPGIDDDEFPPGEEPRKISEETKENVTEAPGAAEEEPPPPGVDIEEEKKQTEEERDKDNLDELTEQKKHSSLGAVLSGLSTGSYGSKAKENVVKVEVSGPRKRYHNDNWGPNKRFGGVGIGGGQFEGGWGGNWGAGGGGGGGGGGWGGNNWNSWNDQYTYGSYDGYEEEAEEEDTGPSEAWIAEETKLLEEEFGPGIISIMYDDDGGMMYICDICQSQMNGRKSLDVHINGMKHLKKKNIWEKKRRLENFKEPSEDKKDDKDEKKPDSNKGPAGIKGGNNTSLGGFPNLYTQPPPVVPGIHPVSFPPPVMGPTNQWNTPPPQAVVAPQVEEKPKTNLSGGATGTLLQKLAACAVKNLKDSDLATNVIVALVKTMKEYNHGRGDTRSIEVLTEIDVKLRGLKSVMPVVLPESEKSVPKAGAKGNPSNKENTPKSTSAASDPSKTPGNSYYSSTAKPDSEAPKYSRGGSGKPSYPSSDSGTWYSQGKGSTAESSYASQSSDAKKTPASNHDFTSQPPPKTGYESNTKTDTGYANNYSSYNITQNPPPAKDASGYQAKPPVGYYSQPPYSQPPAAVMDIIASAPPPPPPVDNSGYAGYGNQYSGGYGSYYNTGGPQTF